MLSPAHLLLIERLIQFLLILVRAFDQAAEGGRPSFRRAATRLALSRLADHLARLRESNLAPDAQDHPQASPAPRIDPAPAPPIPGRAPSPTPIERRLRPETRPLTLKDLLALGPSHA